MIGFKSKKMKVNLNQAIKATEKADTAEVLKTVDEDRKFAIQATIVRFVKHSISTGRPYSNYLISPFLCRIMKARKTMSNQALIQEVISQISTRFMPKIPDIKKAIDVLLEKEYMERVDGTKNMFAYVA